MSVFVTAELGVNWNGDRTKLVAMLDAAKAAGADAAKLQVFNAEALIKRRQIPADAMVGGYKVHDVLRACELTDDDIDAIAAHCKAIGIRWFASVFDPSQIERVLSRGACALKIGHAEAGWDGLIQACYAACTKFGLYRDGYCALWVSGPERHIQRAGYSDDKRDYPPTDEVAYVPNVLCTTEYPAASPPNLAKLGKHPYRGFSSHYTDYRIPAAAALRGAEYIEAHLKLSDDDPEAAWSLSPDDFGKMVKLIREYETWL